MRDSWFLQRDGAEVGPMAPTRLAELAEEGTLRPHDLVRRDGTSVWILARQLQGLKFGEVPSAAAAPPPQPPKIDVLLATTADGRGVELRSDGTWRFVAKPPSSSSLPARKTAGGFSDHLKLRKETGADFRNAYWGMAQREVRATEQSPFENADDELLIYTGNFAEKACRIQYRFANNFLVSGSYIFDAEFIDPTELINEYSELKSALRKQFGEPMDRRGSQSGQIWLDNAYRNHPENWGRAISLGHLYFLTVWTREKTRINLVLKGENYDVQLLIEFVSPDPLAVQAPG